MQKYAVLARESDNACEKNIVARTGIVVLSFFWLIPSQITTISSVFEN